MKQYVPSILTAGNLVCGFTAIMIGDFYWSPILLLCSFLFDSLDGLVARMLHAQSDFGKQMDSLADVISFGVAPAYLYSLYSPDFENRWYTISTCALIVVAGTIRLAKFNITPSKPYFMGLPIPANALFYIGVIIAIENESSAFIHFFDSKINYFITPLFLSLMMISFPLRMFSTKSMSKDWRDNIFPFLMAILSIAIFYLTRFQAVAIIVIVYILLSVVHTIFSKYVWRKI